MEGWTAIACRLAQSSKNPFLILYLSAIVGQYSEKFSFQVANFFLFKMRVTVKTLWEFVLIISKFYALFINYGQQN